MSRTVQFFSTFFLALILAVIFSLPFSSTVEAKSVSWTNFFDSTPSNVFRAYLNQIPIAASLPSFGSGSWDLTFRDAQLSIGYEASVINGGTGSVINDGASVPVGTDVRFVPKNFEGTDINWSAVGWHYDTPYGYWVTNADKPYTPIDCRGQDYVTTVWAEVWNDSYSPLSINPPGVSMVHNGTAGLSCTNNGFNCTVTSPGTINSNVVFGSTYGKFYYGTKLHGNFGDYPEVSSPYCQQVIDGWECVTYCISASDAMTLPASPANANGASSFTVPAQTINFTFDAIGAPNSVNPPVIDGPTTGTTNTSYTFGVRATDNENDTVSYDIDWDNNGVTDQRLPGSGYTPSGTRLSTTHTWPSAGTYIVRARTQDSKSLASAWVSHTINISVPPNTVNPPTIDGPTTGTANTSYTFGFRATDNEGDTVRYIVDWNRDGVIDAYLPSGTTYTTSGTRLTAPRTWTTGGAYTFQARTQDSRGLLSTWSTYTVTLSVPTLTASCSVSPTSTLINQPVTWTATVGGGTGTYSYNWTGTDSLSGTTPTVNKTYSVIGTKTGSVTITSGTQSRTVTCTNSLVVNAPDLYAVADPIPNTIIGTAITFTGRVRNDISATASAGPSTATFRISNNNDGDWTDAGEIADAGTFRYTTTLAPNAGSGQRLSSRTWTPTTIGTYWVYLCADTGREVSESNESNNCSAATTVTVNGQPDLTAIIEPTPTSVTVNNPVNLRGRVRNLVPATGDAGASDARFQFKLASASTWTNVGALVPTQALPLGFGSGIIPPISAPAITWTPTALGTYNLQFCADVGNIITELNETNNCSALRAITVNPPLIVSCVPSTSVVDAGEDMEWRVTASGVTDPWFVWAAVPSGTGVCTSSFPPNNTPNTCHYFTGGTTQTMSVRLNGTTYSCGSVQVRTVTTPTPLSVSCNSFATSNTVIQWWPSISGGAGGETYLWSLSSGSPTPSATRRNISSTHSPGDTVSGTIRVTDRNGITDTATCAAVTLPSAPAPVCGNNIVETGETCDDGDTISGDGCSATCATESSLVCNSNLTCEPLRGETPLNCTDCKKDIEEE